LVSPTIVPTLAATQQSIIATETFIPVPAPTVQLPASEADVPRVSVTDAKAAFDKGQAIIVDVRAPQSFELGHVKGAINIPLGTITTDPVILKLDKHQWIITYCT
jgi:3-mercaptopyruvate sulfurtransferase SseA